MSRHQSIDHLFNSQAILIGVGLQNKNMDDLQKEFNMPVNQILAKFYDCLKKITKKLRSVLETTIEETMVKTSTLNTGYDMMATGQTFAEELNEAAMELERKQKKELKRLKKENLSNFAIKGTDEEWGKALSMNKSSIVSVKR